MEHILQATDLVMDYSTQQATPNATHMLALNHVDFGIQAGESIAVMGPSGSGKSTLLHALAGIITPTAGNVMFRGANLARLSDADRTKLRRSASASAHREEGRKALSHSAPARRQYFSKSSAAAFV